MSDIKYTVYELVSPTGKRYIGATKNRLILRWNHGHGYKHNERLYRDIQEFGWDSFQHNVLKTGLVEEQAYEEEKRYIALYNTTNPVYGYNTSTGGKFSATGVHHRGEDAAHYNMFHTDATKIHISRSKGVLGVHCVETGITYPTLTVASKQTGVSIPHICGCCRGKRKSAGGYHWKYVKEEYT